MMWQYVVESGVWSAGGLIVGFLVGRGVAEIRVRLDHSIAEIQVRLDRIEKYDRERTEKRD